MAVIFGILLIVTALLFYRTTESVTDSYSEKVQERNHELIVSQSQLVMEQLYLHSVPLKPKKISAAILEITRNKPEFLYLMIFRKSADENYFTLKKKIPLSEDLAMDLTEGKTLQEGKNSEFLKKGQLNTIADPAIYKKGRFNWQHVYQPYTVGKKSLVLQFFISAAAAETTIQSLNETINNNRKILMVTSIILVVILSILFILFTQNYSSLMSNLSRYMKMAAEGNLDVNINNVDDEELNQLALSFNTLVEEMRDLKEKEQVSMNQEEENSGEDITDSLFKRGVDYLKENRLEAAITCFLFIADHREASFGSYFNLGVAYAKQKAYGESLIMFEKASKINPLHETTRKYIERVNRLLEKDAPN